MLYILDCSPNNDSADANLCGYYELLQATTASSLAFCAIAESMPKRLAFPKLRATEASMYILLIADQPMILKYPSVSDTFDVDYFEHCT